MEPLINFVIRPPRAEYDPKNDLLDQEFMLKGKWFQRKDLEIVNSRGDVLQCSHYMPIVRPEEKALPFVIYCHGNSGCRADASEAAIILLPSNITVFTLDFSGSGISGGEHVTLGWNENEGLRVVVNYLREDGNVSLIGLWGRSMGAVTRLHEVILTDLANGPASLMYGAEDPSIAGMIVNSRGDVLQCSHYMPIVRPEEKALPFVIYCHGNSGCRADASEAAIILLPSNITVFTLDFSGSGISGGEHVTLGWNENEGLRVVVNYLREDGNVSLIGLWGRSMGAVTRNGYLVDLMMELVDTYKIRLPKFTVAKSSFVPVLLGHAIDDDFMQPHHSDRIFDSYVGDKNIIKFEGVHNSPRPQFYFDSINIFFHNVLHPPEDEVVGSFFDSSHDYFGKGSWSTVHDVGYADDFLAAPGAPRTSGTEDAINQLRSKRPMRKTEVPSDISSRDKQSEAQEEGSGTRPTTSYSKMINFELSNGHFDGLHVPTSVDDDGYVEYSFDHMPDFPSNVEEEERMFMEAVIESLKDLEIRHPHIEEQQSSVSTEPHKPSRRDDPGDATTRDCNVSSITADPATATATSTAVLVAIDNDMVFQLHSLDTSISSIVTPPNSISRESECTRDSSCSDSSGGIQSSSETDSADGTKATVTVIKNPTSNIMDGLLRRWDLNFFKNR